MQEAERIASADRLLIVAAAGLSISQEHPNNPYHSAADFALHYPQLVKHGYRTSFEAMGLSSDENVPLAIRLAHTAQHFLNMRFRFPPTEAYSWLLELARGFDQEDVFCWTSNVDGCFERAGFDRSRVYTTQGEMSKYQCARTRECGHVWDIEDQLREADAACTNGVLTDLGRARWTSCPKCGGETLPSLRGGDWFNHKPYEPTQERLLAWLDECVANKLSVAVIEVGVGPNTPVVTSIPACAFASAVAAAGGQASYLRVNPDLEVHGNQPAEMVQFSHWRSSWSTLQQLVQHVGVLRTQDRSSGSKSPHCLNTQQRDCTKSEAQERYTEILMSLRTPRR